MNLEQNVELRSHYSKFTSISRWLQVWWRTYLYPETSRQDIKLEFTSFKTRKTKEFVTAPADSKNPRSKLQTVHFSSSITQGTLKRTDWIMGHTKTHGSCLSFCFTTFFMPFWSILACTSTWNKTKVFVVK
jgi:hypothetical protein